MFVGGAFFAPLQDCSLSFWNHVREELGKQGVDAGFVVLGYGMRSFFVCNHPLTSRQAYTLNIPSPRSYASWQSPSITSLPQA